MPIFSQVKSEISTLPQIHASNQNLTSTAKTTNGYDSHDFIVVNNALFKCCLKLIHIFCLEKTFQRNH